MKAHFLVHDKFEETKYEVMGTEEMSRKFLYVRLNTVLPLSCEATINGVKNIMQNKRKKVRIKPWHRLCEIGIFSMMPRFFVCMYAPKAAEVGFTRRVYAA